MSIFTQRERQLVELETVMQQLEEGLDRDGGDTCKSRLDAIEEGLATLNAAVGGYLKKVAAGEKDPNKKIYGTAMTERIKKMDAGLKGVSGKLEEVKPSVAKILEKEEMERVKKEKEEMEMKKMEEEERLKKEAEIQAEKDSKEAAEAAAKKAETDRLASIAEEKKARLLQAKKEAEEKRAAVMRAESTSMDAVESSDSKAASVRLRIVKASGSALEIGPVPVEQTVGNVKEQIASRESNVPVSSQRLIFEGKILSNTSTLVSLGVEKDTTLYFIALPANYVARENAPATPPPKESATPMDTEPPVATEGMITVKLKNKAGTRPIVVAHDGTVLDFKTAVEKAIGTSTADMRFVFQAKVLKDAEKLSEMGIKDQSTIYSMDRNPTASATKTAAPAAAPASPKAPTQATTATRDFTAPAATAAPPATTVAMDTSSASSAPPSGIRPMPAPCGSIFKVTQGADELGPILKACGSTRLCIVDWNASWCGPCRVMAGVFERLAIENPDISFVSIDQEASTLNTALFQSKGITQLPTFHFYADGKNFFQVVGAAEQSLVGGIDQFRQVQNTAAQQGQLTAVVMRNLQVLKFASTDEEFNTAIKTLISYLSNVTNNPGIEKYRKIRMQNSAFQKRLCRFPGGFDCLLAFGFKREFANGEGMLIISEADAARPELTTVNQQLQHALQMFTGDSSTGGGSSTGVTAETPSPAAPAPSSGEVTEETEQQLLEEAIRLSLQEEEERERREREGQ